MVQSERPRHNMVGEDGISSNAGSKNMDRLKRFGPSGVLGLLLLAFVLGNTDSTTCLLYTSDAADERSSVDLGGRRIIKKKNYIDTSI